MPINQRLGLFLLISLALHAALVWLILWRFESEVEPTRPNAGSIEIRLKPVASATGEPDVSSVSKVEPESTPRPELRPKPERKPKLKPRVQSQFVVTAPSAPLKLTSQKNNVGEQEVAPDNDANAKKPSQAASRQGVGDGIPDGAQGRKAQSRAKAEYLAAVQRWLERHKAYPRQARRRQQQGTATLKFTLEPDGRVSRYRLLHSSGHQLLDQAVLAMIQRAQPLPVMPKSLGHLPIQLSLPVRFVLE